jgi:parallel beta-helix repeat protein
MSSQIIQTGDGGYTVLGSFTNYIDYTFYGRDTLVKMDSSGNIKWNQTVRGSTRIVQTSDAGYVIIGNGEGGVILSKVDSKGMFQWNQTYKVLSQDNFGNAAASMVQTKDGGYAIAGNTGRYLNAEPPTQALLIKTNSKGNMAWSRTYGQKEHTNFFTSVAQTSDGGYLLAGATSDGAAGGLDFWLVKTNSVGDPQWTKIYGGANDDEAKSLVHTKDGGFAIVGNTASFGADGFSQAWLVKTDSSGNLQWTRTYDGSANSLIQTSDGGLAFAGSQEDNAWLVKTDSVGNVEWNQRFGNLHWTGYVGDRNSVSANSVIETGDGGFALAATLRSPRYSRGGFYWYLAKTGPASSSSSTPQSSGPTPVLAFPAITIKADGNVEPSSASLERNGNVYKFTQNLNGPLDIEKDNIVVDGDSHSLQGNGAIAGLYIKVTETGIAFTGRTNVTVKDIKISGYQYGFVLDGSDYITISGNTLSQNAQGIFVTGSAFTSILGNLITQNCQGIIVTDGSSNSRISDNSILANHGDGVWLNYTNGNIIYGNKISNNTSDYLPAGILLDSGLNNLITGNAFDGDLFGIHINGFSDVVIVGNTFTNCERSARGDNASGSLFYMNNFNNTHPNVFDDGINSWDNSTVGNYWSNYTQEYPGAKEVDSLGTGDVPYVIGTNNTDHHPLLMPVSSDVILSLAAALVIAHEPSTTPSPPKVVSPSTLVLLATAVVVIAIVLGAVAVLIHKKKKN